MVVGRRKWALSLGLLGVFLAGAVTAALATAGYVHHRLRSLHAGGPHAIHALGMAWLEQELDLTPDQKASIERILLDTHMELFRFKSRHNDEIRAIVLPALDRIDAALTPQQVETWRKTRDRIVEHAEATVDTRSGR
jgi:hypothetical protein